MRSRKKSPVHSGALRSVQANQRSSRVVLRALSSLGNGDGIVLSAGYTPDLEGVWTGTLGLACYQSL
jgi:hypothetical protein